MPFTRSPFTCTSGRPFRALKKPIKGSKSVERGYFLLMRAVLLAALAAGVLAANDDGHRGGKPLTAQESGFKAGNDYHVNEQQLGANASIPTASIREAQAEDAPLGRGGGQDGRHLQLPRRSHPRRHLRRDCLTSTLRSHCPT